MDDAATRRGRPSCHRRFDEATAILAGDALQSLAFAVLADPATHPKAAVRCQLVARLAAAAGAFGMCGGQMIDLAAEGCTLELAEVLELQRLKTGALLEFACDGAILGGADDAERSILRAYAADLGLAFQIQDDLLDVTGDAALAGKDLGRDQAAGKATVVGLVGLDGARARLAALRASADDLDRLGREAGVLREVFEFVISRTSQVPPAEVRTTAVVSLRARSNRIRRRIEPHDQTPLLDTIDEPSALRRLPPESLRQLAGQLHSETIDAVSVTGGHLGAGSATGRTHGRAALRVRARRRTSWSGTSGIRPTRSLTGRRGGIRTTCLGLHQACREPLRPVRRGAARPRSRRRSAWRPRAIWRARTST